MPPLNFRLPLPRKGTETSSSTTSTLNLAVIFPTTFTPQGDGNPLIASCAILSALYFRLPLPRKGTETEIEFYSPHSKKKRFPTTFTPQGDGNAVKEAT